MSLEGLTTFVLVAIVYSIVVEQFVVWLVRKHIIVKIKEGWGRFLLASCLLLTSRVFLPVAIVVYVEQSSLASMGIYLPYSFWVFPAIPVAFFVVTGFSLLEDIYRVKYLNRDPQAIIELHTPANYKIEFVNQLIIAGLPEEFLYRGYFLSRLIIGFDRIFGIFLSSLYFGIAHMWSIVKGKRVGDKYKALRTFIVAIIFAIVFVYFGLIPCIILHICGNLSYGWISKLTLPRLTRKNL